LKTTESIYEEYSGVDKPEQIKYFIKDALENPGNYLGSPCRWIKKHILLPNHG